MRRMSDLNLRRKKERKAEIHKLKSRDSYTHPHSTDIFLSKQVYARVYTVKEAIISIYVTLFHTQNRSRSVSWALLFCPDQYW